MPSSFSYYLFYVSRRNPLSLVNPLSILLIPFKIFFALYIRIKGIREGLNDDIYRYYINKNTRFTVGKHSYGYLQFGDRYSKLKSIGAFCSIGANVKIVGMSHPMQYVTTSPILNSKRFGFRNSDLDLSDFNNSKWDIHIGNDVYIGQDAKILPGVRIGNGAVVGAGSLVTKDVPGYAIVAGIPAEVVRYRFPPDIIHALERMKWWEWEDEKIKKNLNLMINVNEFVTKFEPE